MIDNLVFMHQVIIASENLLRTAIAACDDTPFGRRLAAYYRAHLDEERGHEQWLAEDLASAGIDVAAMPLSLKAVEMAGTQYYVIQHVHAVSLLGYMAVLEGDPMPLETVAALEAAHGKALFRTLRYHAEHDIEHGKDLNEILGEVPQELMHHVINSANQTRHYLTEAAKEWRT